VIHRVTTGEAIRRWLGPQKRGRIRTDCVNGRLAVVPADRRRETGVAPRSENPLPFIASPEPLDENEGLPYEEEPPRSLGYSATRLSWASALLLATNLIWILAVALNLLGPLGPLTAGILAWVAFTLDIPGALLLGAAYVRLTREEGDPRINRRAAIFWGLVGWAFLSANWRFVIPLVTGTDVQDLFQGLLGANPGSLIQARNAWASVQAIFAVWIAAAALFFGVHILIAIDYRRSPDEEWTSGIPAYAWLMGTGLSFVSTILIAAALLPVLAGGLIGPTFIAGAVGKLLVTPNLMLSGYVSSLDLGRVARRKADAGRGWP